MSKELKDAIKDILAYGSIFFLGFLVAQLFSFHAGATLNDVDKQSFLGKNLLNNGGVENGKAGWSETDADTDATFELSTVEAETAMFMHSGRVNIMWQAGDSADILNMPTITITKGLVSRNMVYSCAFRANQTGVTDDYTFQVYDGTNVLVSTTITPNFTTTRRVSLNFSHATHGTAIRGRLTTSATPAAIGVDDCWAGPASDFNIATTLNRDTFSAFVAGTSGGNGTVSNENVDWIDGNCTNADPKVCTFKSGIFSAAPNCVAQAYDATGGLGQMEINAVSSTSITIDVNRNAAAGDGATARAFYIQCQKSGADSQQAAYRPDQVANSWSGYHDNTCSWARTNTAYGAVTDDASCNLVQRTNANFGTVSTSGSVSPAIVFTPSRAGRYYVCALPKVGAGSGAAGTTYASRLWDGTTVIAEDGSESVSGGPPITMSLCGIYVATSTSPVTLTVQTKASTGSITINEVTAAASIEWSIFQIDQQLPAPLLVNSVVSSYTGVTGIEVAELNCDASSAITRQHGSWVSSIGNVSSGACAITLNSGIFSGTPYCTLGPQTQGSAANGHTVTAASSTSVTIDCEIEGSTACTAYDVFLQCVGPK